MWGTLRVTAPPPHAAARAALVFLPLGDLMMKKKSLLISLALATLCTSGLIGAVQPPSEASVGDADSFGNRVVWIGLLGTGLVTLTGDCTSVPLGPDDRCVTLPPYGAPTPFRSSIWAALRCPPTAPTPSYATGRRRASAIRCSIPRAGPYWPRSLLHRRSG